MIILETLVCLLVVAIGYWWMEVNKRNSKLKWIREIPRPSILGHSSVFEDPAEIINVMSRYLKESGGLCTIELNNRKAILASEHTFVEFLLGKMEILNKSEEYKFYSNWLGTGLFTAEATKWKKTRKMLTPSFHLSVLDTFIEYFERNGDILIELLEKETAEDSVDMFPYFGMTALDIICETAMGVSINAQRNPKSDYVHAVKEEGRIILERSFSFIKSLDFIYRFTSDYYKEQEYIKILHSHTLNVIRSRRELKPNEAEEDLKNNDLGIKRRKVFLDLLLETTLDGRPLTEIEIREEVDTFMLAGHDTTAPAMSFTLYLISLHKDVQDQLIEEQKRIFGNDKNRLTTNRDLQEMKYLDMTIKEALRLYPSVPFISRITDRDVEYKDGQIIPAGTRVYAVLFCINRDSKIFPDPDKFDPSRFANNLNVKPYTYLPFSAGPRNCIGQKYAMSMMRSLISKIVRNYEILPSGHELKLTIDSVLTSQTGMRVKLKKRDWDKI